MERELHCGCACGTVCLAPPVEGEERQGSRARVTSVEQAEITVGHSLTCIPTMACESLA